MKLMWANEPSFTNDQLRTIMAPTLLIIGDDDIVTPEHAAGWRRRFPMHGFAWFRTPVTGRCPGRRS
jgi:pimeloyl-ACP methyl ester carboxylesterase